MFTVTGIFEGVVASVTWDAGEFVVNQETDEADVAAILGVELRAARLAGQEVGPVGGPYTFENHLADPLSALFVIREAFDEIGIVEGDVPEAENEAGRVY